MRLASFNVNSVNARSDAIREWLSINDIDVLCLQELKCVNEKFPHDLFEGYESIIHGQKRFNGVATCSKYSIESHSVEFEGQKGDSRFICTQIDDFYLINLYVPAGDLYEEKHTFKLYFYEKLFKYLERFDLTKDNVIITGDLNIAHTPLDVYDPIAFEGHVSYLPEERRIFEQLLSLGFYDTFRELNPQEKSFSWFSYKGFGVYKNEGIRIDYFLCTAPMMKRVKDAYIDIKPRRKRHHTPSDHTPVILEIL